jgi:hypothetical protein
VATFEGGIDTTRVGGTVMLPASLGTFGKQADFGDVSLQFDTTLYTTGGGFTGGANLNTGAVAGNDNSLTLDSGTGGKIQVGDAVNNVETLDIRQSNGAEFKDLVAVTTLDISDTRNGADVRFMKDVAADTLITTDNAYNVRFDEDVTIVNDVTFRAIGDLTIGNGVEDIALFNGGVDTRNVTGEVKIDGNVRTSGNQADFDDITFGSDAVIDTTNAGGSPAGADVYLGDVDGTPQKYDLVVMTGIRSNVNADSFDGGLLDVSARGLTVDGPLQGNLKAGNQGEDINVTFKDKVTGNVGIDDTSNVVLTAQNAVGGDVRIDSDGGVKVTLAGRVGGGIDIDARQDIETFSDINANGDVMMDTRGHVLLGGDITAQNIFFNQDHYDKISRTADSGDVKSTTGKDVNLKADNGNGTIEIYAGGQIGDPNAKLQLDFNQATVFTASKIISIDFAKGTINILGGSLRGTQALNQSSRESGLTNIDLGGYIDPALFGYVQTYTTIGGGLMLPPDQEEEEDEFTGPSSGKFWFISSIFQKTKKTLASWFQDMI